MPPTPPPPTEEQAAKSLLPLLQQPPWLKQARLQHTIPVVSRPFVTGVVITYVFDYPDSRAYINQDIMAQIMKNTSGHDEIHEYALENLRHRTTRHSYKTYGRGERKLIVCDTKDGYAATRVLLPELMEKWAKRFRGRMLIGIPNRDFLIAFSERHPSGVESIARQVRRDAKKRHYPLSSRLLRWQNGKIAEYRPVQ